MSRPPPQLHDPSHDQFEAKTGQEVPPNQNTVEPIKPLSPIIEGISDHAPSQSTGQAVALVTHCRDNQEKESPSPKHADSTQSSPVATKLKPPTLDLTSATPTLSDSTTPPYHDQGPHLSPMVKQRRLWEYSPGEDFTSSIRSLPSTFSPITHKSTQRFLGYNPMHLPEVTLSYPELGPPVSISVWCVSV